MCIKALYVFYYVFIHLKKKSVPQRSSFCIMCKIKGKKIKSKFLSFSHLVLYDLVSITKSIGTMQNFGINDITTQHHIEGGGQKKWKWEERFSNTPIY